MPKDTPPPQPSDGLPTTAQTAALMGQLMKQSVTDQKLLSLIVNELITLPINDKTIRQTWDNFPVTKREPVFTNNVMINRAGMVRVSLSVSRAVKVISHINNNGAYLNQSNEIAAECLYVFDIPLNPNDALNLALEFDDADIKTATIKMIRLQEIR